jgi:hypothetical protein
MFNIFSVHNLGNRLFLTNMGIYIYKGSFPLGVTEQGGVLGGVVSEVVIPTMKRW